MSHAVAVDPGIDDAGVACFDLKDWKKGESFAQAVGRLVHYQVMRTGPRDPLPQRLGGLFAGLAAIVEQFEPGHVYIEKPATSGAYWKRLRRQFSKTTINAAALEKLNMAIGALVAGALSGSIYPLAVVMVPAPTIDKMLRLQIVRAELRKHNHPLGLREKVSQDLLDAIYLGAYALSSPHYMPSTS